MADISFTNLTNLPPEIATDLENINRRRKIQEAMLAKTMMQPHQTQIGRSGAYSVAAPYSPWEGATSLIKAAMLGSMGKRSNQDLSDLGTRFRNEEADAVKNVHMQARGQEGWEQSGPMQPGVQRPIVGEVAPDILGAITTGAGSPYKGAQRVSKALQKQQLANRGRGAYFKPIKVTLRSPDGNTTTVPGFADTRGTTTGGQSPTILDASGNPFPPGVQVMSIEDPMATAHREFGKGYGGAMGDQAGRGGNIYPGMLPPVAPGQAMPAAIPSEASLEATKQNVMDTAAMQNPNSPEYRTARGKHAGDYEKYRTLINTKNKVKEDIEYILDPNNRAAFEANFGGLQAYATREIPFDATQAMKAKINSLKASLKAAGKQLATADGTSIGQITEREWPILEQQIATLTPRLGEGEREGDAAGVLQGILNVLNGMQDTATATYEKSWNNTPFYEKYTDLSTAPPGVDPVIWKGMSEERRREYMKAGEQ